MNTLDRAAVSVFLFILLCSAEIIYADSYSGSLVDEACIMRVPVWVFLEPQPATMSEDERGELMPPIKALHEISEFILSGMTYGWKFSYCPSDKKRAVTEFFELLPIYKIPKDSGRITLTELKPKYPYLYCWAEYRISQDDALRREKWKSITYKTVKGRGSAKRKEEITGIYKAYHEAVKQAIRNYAKRVEKNKPKEIIGELLLKENPRLFMESGTFYADVEIYLQIKEIVPYSVF